MIKTTIYFATRNRDEITRIRTEYAIHGILSVNGEIECEIDEATLQQLKAEVAAGLITLRNKK